ncbi:GFA family protein [Methylobacterium platani]|uniref:Aldehyde-activating protein n=2 Tax=Methylobacterium platani TaxID=427683 RepID=A0A179SEZ5_9HYPH|nr:GFA family protein [Methylobacterium platani]KMO12631.1 aldehyde-activating protein [Methylobacterium platani JCM 14648]OAS25532.1 aldehyde-activating protein [Methylobacterium platani]
MLTGSCLCGTVAFTVEEPLPGLYQCHCSLCRKATGSSNNTAAIVATSRFRWMRGGEAIRSFVRDTGYRNDFCTTCGSTVPNLMTSGETMWIPAGLLDEPTGAAVTTHLFVASKAEWDEIGGTGQSYPGMPDRLP